MKIFSASQIRDLDKKSIEIQNISSWELMERASAEFFLWFVSRFTSSSEIYIFCGPGNNGGDGLAIARMLINSGYSVQIFTIAGNNASTDYIRNLELLQQMTKVNSIENPNDIPAIKKGTIVIDALFGSGLNKPLTGLFAAVINLMNLSGAIIVCVDVASGLFCDASSNEKTIVKPAYTVSFQLPKLAFMLPENHEFVGEWHLVDIGLDNDTINNTPSPYEYLTSSFINPLIKKRKKFSHKGTYGKALIIAGSYGMIGASVLATKACYRSGAGLVVAYVPGCGYNILQSAVPEAMVLTDINQEIITSLPDITPYNAIGIGPGFSEGPEATGVVNHLFGINKNPVVIDAGALNILSKNKHLLPLMPENSILTPHPKEFERLCGKSDNDFERLEKLKNFALDFKCFVILKGAHTAIATPEGKVFFNSTGNAGMATGGSGDILTGIITGLLCQSYTPYEAALLGVFMHGIAGDFAAKEKSQQSLMASDIIEGINYFYKALSYD